MSQTNAQKKAALKRQAKQKTRKDKVRTGRAKAAESLREQNGQLQLAMLNLRTMYDQKVMELGGLQQQMGMKDVLLTAAALKADIVLTADDLELAQSDEFIGYDLDTSDDSGQITISVVPAEEEEDDGEEDNK